MKKNVLLFASLFVLFFISCNDDDPATKSTFSIQQKQLLKKSSITNKKATAILPGTFVFSKVLMGVSKIEFEKKFEKNDVEMESEIEYKGNFEFNVLNGTSTPSLPPVDLEPGIYHELEFNVDTVLSTGNSIEINGTFDDGITIYSFEFSSMMEEEFEIENKNGINLSENNIASFILYLSLEELFAGIDFISIQVDTDGIIRINSNSNSKISSKIEHNLENIMDFEEENEQHNDN